MARTVLLTEADSLLGAAIARILASKGFAIAAASAIPDRTAAGGAVTGSAPRPGGPAPCIAVKWNGRSPVSARGVLLSALNAFDDIDEAIIISPPSPPAAETVQIASADVERGFDGCKGVVFLVREVLAHFLRRGAGVVSMVSYSALPDENGPPLARAMRECFRGFASSLLGSQPANGLILNGFQALGVPPEEFAVFIDKTLEEKARKISSRWFTCQPRGGFLQSVLRTSALR